MDIPVNPSELVLEEVLWPAREVYGLVHRLVDQSQLAPLPSGLSEPIIDPSTFASSLTLAAERLGLEAHPAPPSGEDIVERLGSVAPAIVLVERGHESFALGVLRGQPDGLTVLSMAGVPRALRRQSLQTLITGSPLACAPKDVPDGGPYHGTLGFSEAPSARPIPSVYARLRSWSEKPTDEKTSVSAWVLDISPRTSLKSQLKGSGIGRQALILGLLFAVRIGVFGLAWSILGLGALRGRLESALLIAWGLALLTVVLVSSLVDWMQEHLLLEVNARYRKKIVHGAIRMNALRGREGLGSAQLIGRALETEALDTLALHAGISGATALIDLSFSLGLFLLIPGAQLLALTLSIWIVIVVARALPLYKIQREWTDTRVRMSGNIVEALIGRRTRTIQFPKGHRHRTEDHELQRYLELSKRMDEAEASFEVLAPRGWLVAAALTLGVLSYGAVLSGAPLVAAVGGLILTFSAFARAATSVHLVAVFAIAWEQAKPLYQASMVADPTGMPDAVENNRRLLAQDETLTKLGTPILMANGLSLVPSPLRPAVVQGASLNIHLGDRILLGGPSGGGKSSLARLLAGLSAPTTGAVLLRGLDLETTGPQEWKRQIVYVPPFGRNYVLSTSFAHNLFMSRWPVSSSDLDGAAALCTELGLGPLIKRMPGGLQQVVGETGWRLSHGEQARLFLARAMLQRPDVIILDESFGSLDPATTRLALDCVLRHCSTLVIISHE